MPIKESKVIENIKKLFKKIFKNPSITKIHISPLHNRGFPDLLITTEYGVFFIEAKGPGKKPTALQKAKLVELKESGKDSIYCYWATCNKQDSNELIFFDPKDNKEKCRMSLKRL